MAASKKTKREKEQHLWGVDIAYTPYFIYTLSPASECFFQPAYVIMLYIL